MLTVNRTELKQHPLSAAFPAMPAEQFQALKDSIMDIGVQEPITLFEGMVIDGWHRYTAADELGADCPTVDLGDVDPQSFVVAKNKARRHITQSQIAAAIVAVYGWRPTGRPEKAEPGSAFSKTTDQLAEMAGVSDRMIRQAKAVESKATPEIKAAVRSGAMSVKKAAETVNPPRFKGKPKKVPAAKLLAAEIKAAQLQKEVASLREQVAGSSGSESAATTPEAGDFEDHGADFDPLEELEAANAENVKLRTMLESSDLGAEALKHLRAYEVAQRRSDEHLTTIANRDRQIDFLARQLRRCGKAVGELDQDKIAPAVEAMARAGKGVK